MSETIEKSFTVSSPAQLDLSNIRGMVEIRAGQAGIIHVTATKITSSGDAKRTEIELTQGADGTVRVATLFPEAAWGWLFGSFPCQVEYIVQAPRTCSLKVNGVSNEMVAEGFEGEFSFKSVSGDMTLRNLQGSVKVNTVSGAVEMAELTGNLRLTTVSGKVTGKRVNGPVHLDTVSGKVSLEESSLSSVEAKTVSGGMLYQTGFGAGPYRFNSVSGNVQLLVPGDTRCSAELHAISGKISTKLPASSVSQQRGSQSIDIQGGGVKVFLQSVSGNLSLLS